MFHERHDLKLIRLVRDNSVLYDFNNEKYMDFNAREVAWQKIGDELKRAGADCKIRWINIRDVHRRILRKNLTKNGSQKAYKYGNELNFMRPFYKDVAPPLKGSEDGDADDKGNDCCTAMCDANDVPEAACSDDSDKPIKKIKAKKRKPKKRKEIPEIPEIPETLNNEEEEQQATPTFVETAEMSVGDFEVSDPVDAFLLSIGATLKTFSPYHLNVAKSKIFAVVQEHDLQQIVQKERQDDVDVVQAPTSDQIVYIM